MNRRALIAMSAFSLAGLGVRGAHAQAPAPSPTPGSPTPAQGTAPAFLPAIVYAVGQKFDRSFNEAAFGGAERFRLASGVAYFEVEPRAPVEFEAAVPALVRRGVTDIVAVGFYYAIPLANLAPQFPNVRFTLIDGVDAPNVQSVVWREQETLSRHARGARQPQRHRRLRRGARYPADPPLYRGLRCRRPLRAARHVVLTGFVGTTPDAFNDRRAAGSRAQFDRGSTSFTRRRISTRRASAPSTRRLAIGVDSSQNALHPARSPSLIACRRRGRIELALGRGGQRRPPLAGPPRRPEPRLRRAQRSLVTDAMRARRRSARGHHRRPPRRPRRHAP
jgi:basic membrane protein A